MRSIIFGFILVVLSTHCVYSETFSSSKTQDRINTRLKQITDNDERINEYQVETLSSIESYQYDELNNIWLVGCVVYTFVNQDTDSRFVYGVIGIGDDEETIINQVVSEWRGVFYEAFAKCLGGGEPTIRKGEVDYYFGPTVVRGDQPAFFNTNGISLNESIVGSIHEFVEKTKIARDGEYNDLSGIGSMNLKFFVNSSGDIERDAQFLWNGQYQPWLYSIIDEIGWQGSESGYLIKVFLFSNNRAKDEKD